MAGISGLLIKRKCTVFGSAAVTVKMGCYFLLQTTPHIHPSIRPKARSIPDFGPCVLQTRNVCAAVITDPVVVSGEVHDRMGLGARG